MSSSRKTLTQHAAEIEQWIAQGWLTGQETFIELQDMAIMTDLIYQEAARPCGCPGGDFGHQGRFQEVLTPLMPRGAPHTLLGPPAHPGRLSRHVARDGAVLAETPCCLIGRQRQQSRRLCAGAAMRVQCPQHQHHHATTGTAQGATRWRDAADAQPHLTPQPTHGDLLPACARVRALGRRGETSQTGQY